LKELSGRFGEVFLSGEAVVILGCSAGDEGLVLNVGVELNV